MWSDIIPVVSQVKSLVQLATGDEEGAKRTAQNFVTGCPIVSQATSLAMVAAGEEELAYETQKFFWKNTGNLVNDTLDGTPGVGHVKGGIHYICGDDEGGHKAMKSATRKAVVAGYGVAGFAIGGPVGAFAMGVTAGVGADAVITGVESTARGKFTPSGIYREIDNLENDRPINPAAFVDMAIDGVTGTANGAGWVDSNAYVRPLFD